MRVFCNFFAVPSPFWDVQAGHSPQGVLDTVANSANEASRKSNSGKFWGILPPIQDGTLQVDAMAQHAKTLKIHLPPGLVWGLLTAAAGCEGRAAVRTGAVERYRVPSSRTMAPSATCDRTSGEQADGSHSGVPWHKGGGRPRLGAIHLHLK